MNAPKDSALEIHVLAAYTQALNGQKPAKLRPDRPLAKLMESVLDQQGNPAIPTEVHVKSKSAGNSLMRIRSRCAHLRIAIDNALIGDENKHLVVTRIEEVPRGHVDSLHRVLSYPWPIYDAIAQQVSSGDNLQSVGFLEDPRRLSTVALQFRSGGVVEFKARCYPEGPREISVEDFVNLTDRFQRLVKSTIEVVNKAKRLDDEEAISESPPRAGLRSALRRVLSSVPSPHP